MWNFGSCLRGSLVEDEPSLLHRDIPAYLGHGSSDHLMIMMCKLFQLTALYSVTSVCLQKKIHTLLEEVNFWKFQG